MGTFTIATGLGMLAVGVVVLAILGTGFIIVVNRNQAIKKEQDQQKREERRSWI